MKQGIYFNLSNEDYHAVKAMSNSGLKDILKDEFVYWSRSPWNPDRVPLNTDALTISKAYHCYLLEPELFDKEYDVIPARVRYDGDKPNHIREKVYDQMRDAIDFIRDGNPAIWKIFKSGRAEVSIFWTDEETGMPCKCRPDFLTFGSCIDYKAMAEVGRGDSEKAIATYDYDMQAAWYLTGLAAIKKIIRGDGDYETDATGVDLKWIKALSEVKHDHDNFVLLFQSKAPPHQIDPAILEKDMLRLGGDFAFTGLLKLKECLDKYGEDMPFYEPITKVRVIGIDDMPKLYDYKIEQRKGE